MLKRGEDRRLRAGHAWVFSNEVDTGRTPLTAFAAGDPVTIAGASGQVIGSGYVNPASLICARVLSRDPAVPFDDRLLRRRIVDALALRDRLYGEPAYRLVYGEGDGLPGLVVDRYGEHLAMQISTAGMERRRETLTAILAELLQPASILMRNDAPVRALEGLGAYVEDALGHTPDTVRLEEAGLKFDVPLRSGQKTGWFFDQRDNRLAVDERLVAGRRVLDVFSYVGAWGLRAAAAGAAATVCVDASPQAVSLLAGNARLNGLEDRVQVVQGEAFAMLRSLHEARERFDVVILDPPAFIKRRREHKSGLQGYRHLHRAALRLLADDGILVTSSCSWHLDRDEFRNILRASALQAGVDLQIIRQGALAADHPVHPAIPETDYLKSCTCRVRSR
ncbi:MAG: class I SAM-dependent rRNA methyltransferase [Gammaproteobacteria bacterium]|nr:class I SAM-dependent rRNA methyltransferase [Gammaproteobacteria bacterium]